LPSRARLAVCRSVQRDPRVADTRLQLRGGTAICVRQLARFDGDNLWFASTRWRGCLCDERRELGRQTAALDPFEDADNAMVTLNNVSILAGQTQPSGTSSMRTGRARQRPGSTGDTMSGKLRSAPKLWQLKIDPLPLVSATDAMPGLRFFLAGTRIDLQFSRVSDALVWASLH
jgi:hypothetical protein